MKAGLLQVMCGILWFMLLLQMVVLTNPRPYTILATHVSAETKRLLEEDKRRPAEYLLKSQDWGGWSEPKIAYQRMLNVQRHCRQAISLLDSTADRIIAASGGYKPRSPSLRYPDNGTWRKKVFPYPESIDSFLQRVDTLNEFLIRNLRPGSYMRDVMRASLPSKWGGVRWDSQDIDRRYMVEAFWYARAAAAVAIVAALKQRIAFAEGAILEELRREATPTCGCCWEAIAGLAIPLTSYVTPGSSVQANIVIAAYNRNANLKKITTSSGRIKEVKSGIATWSDIAGPAGNHPVSGYVWIKVDKVLRKLPWTFSYTSGAPNAGLLLDKANIVYRGIQNPVTLNLQPGFLVDDLQLQVPGAAVSSLEKGRFSILVTKPGLTKLFARIIQVHNNGNTDTIGGLELRVKNPPLPIATLGASPGNSITSSEFRNAPALSLFSPEPDISIAYTVQSFELSYLKKGARQVSEPILIQGASYASHPQVQEYLRQARPGDKVFLGDIIGKEPGGRIIHPAPLSLILE